MKLKQPKKKDQFKNSITDPTKSLFNDSPAGPDSKTGKEPLNLSIYKDERKAFTVLGAKKGLANNKLFSEIFREYLNKYNLTIEQLCKI